MPDREDWTTSEIDEILEELKPIVVPVNISVEGKQRVLSLDEVERILRSANLISLEKCSCREKIRGCDGPLDVCVCMDGQAEEAMAERGAWEVTVGTAMDALTRAHEAGLAHLSFETRAKGRIEIICSCCACCCQTLAAITRMGYDREIVEPSSVMVERDNALCDDCGVCVERCHFEAWAMAGDEVVHESDRCSGCGVCVSSCPSGALKLVRRG